MDHLVASAQTPAAINTTHSPLAPTPGKPLGGGARGLFYDGALNPCAEGGDANFSSFSPFSLVSGAEEEEDLSLERNSAPPPQTPQARKQLISRRESCGRTSLHKTGEGGFYVGTKMSPPPSPLLQLSYSPITSPTNEQEGGGRQKSVYLSLPPCRPPQIVGEGGRKRSLGTSPLFSFSLPCYTPIEAAAAGGFNCGCLERRLSTHAKLYMHVCGKGSRG